MAMDCQEQCGQLMYFNYDIHIYIYHSYLYIYRVSQEECEILRESVP